MKVKLINPQINSNYGATLLSLRGVQDIQRFLNPDESCLQSFKDLRNIYNGVNDIRCLTKDSRVGLIIDCDVDGFTSAAIIYQYLQRLIPEMEIKCYIHDGKAHGLEEHWQEIQDENFNLVIIPDAGSNDSEYAVNLSCPILVIDHHLVEDTNFAQNMIVINNQLSPEYKNKNLSGAGMAFQFCRALDEVFGREWANDYLDLAALGICADMMSGLEIENQYFWKRGFADVKNYFFLTLARKQKYSITGNMYATDAEIMDALNPTSVAFYIVPLINAMIRVGSQTEKERMWIAFTDGHKQIPCYKKGAKGTFEEAAVESARECGNARSHQNKFKDEAVARLEQKIFKHDLLENKILFVRLDPEDQFPSELNGSIISAL